MLEAISDSVGSDLTFSIFFFEQENSKKNDSNKIKKTLNILIKDHFIKIFDFYNFLDRCLCYALTAMGLKYLLSFCLFSCPFKVSNSQFDLFEKNSFNKRLVSWCPPCVVLM